MSRRSSSNNVTQTNGSPEDGGGILINYHEKAPRAKKRSPSSSPSSSPPFTRKTSLSASQSAVNRNAQFLINNWSKEYGIDYDKNLIECMWNKPHGCWCTNKNIESHLVDIIRKNVENTENDGVVCVAVPECCARQFVSLFFTQNPRMRVAYEHIDDDSPCDTGACARVHRMRFSTREASATSQFCTITPRSSK